MSPEFSRFDDTVTRLEATLREHRVEMETVEGDLRANERATSSANRVAMVATVAAIVGVVVGLVGIGVAVDGRSTANTVRGIQKAQIADRKDARTSSCVQANVATKSNRAALVDALIAVLPPGTTPTEAQQAIVERYRAQVEESLPYRDCSDKGIADYFEDPPADPAITEGADS